VVAPPTLPILVALTVTSPRFDGPGGNPARSAGAAEAVPGPCPTSVRRVSPRRERDTWTMRWRWMAGAVLLVVVSLIGWRLL